jgi:hypothetical protein
MPRCPSAHRWSEPAADRAAPPGKTYRDWGVLPQATGSC